MRKQKTNNVKLGIFVLSGLAFLIILLYMIGRNSNLFQSTYTLKARFRNIQGLMAGNNVRYAGIESGTVKRIKILNDTAIEVSLLIDQKLRSVIHKNAVASIGTEGLVGNKVLNIIPSSTPSPLAEEGDLIGSEETVDTDAILRTLATTSNDISMIAAELRTTVYRINNSVALWQLLDDRSVPANIKRSIENIQSTTAKASTIADEVKTLMSDIRQGKGSVGALLTDTQFVSDLNMAVAKIAGAGEEADSLGHEIRNFVAGINNDVNTGKGTIHAIFKDSVFVKKLNTSLDNLQLGTEGFHQNMEALKQSFLFRGYFRKLDKQKKRSSGLEVASE